MKSKENVLLFCAQLQQLRRYCRQHQFQYSQMLQRLYQSETTCQMQKRRQCLNISVLQMIRVYRKLQSQTKMKCHTSQATFQENRLEQERSAVLT